MAAEALCDRAAGSPDPQVETIVDRAMDRKVFLKLTGLTTLALLTLRPGQVLAMGTAPPAVKKRRYGMAIDLKRCVACRACTMACKLENKTPPGMFYTRVDEEELGEYPNVRRRSIPTPCLHCENPPCVPACPIQATFKRENDGIVVVDYEKCKGLGACVTACPYGARALDLGDSYHEGKSEFNKIPSDEYGKKWVREDGQPPIGKVRKCTFCTHLQDGQGNYTDLPACARTCMGKAIHFGDLSDPASEVSQLLGQRPWVRLKEELGTRPSVYYLV
ncbi:MAG: 4Fe-4S dicluster domain-containing protein [Candidatus Omnitrophica bacterium]|nr:4Fe-4S dicluster domain-containing protein [Candidatus Omnitrophota bacterium]